MGIRKEKSQHRNYFLLTEHRKNCFEQIMNCFIPEKYRRQSSDLYRLTGPEWCRLFGEGIGAGVFLTVTFFRDFIWVWISVPIIAVYIRYAVTLKLERRKILLERQFKDAVFSIVSSLQAGVSFANAVKDAGDIITGIYGGDSMLAGLFQRMIWEQEMNVPMDKILNELVQQCQLESVRKFADVVRITGRYGGNMPEILKELADAMESGMTVREELLSVTTAIRYESYAMDAVPVGIIWYINLTAPSFLKILYTSAGGRVFMMVCLGVYVSIVFWQFQIMEHISGY